MSATLFVKHANGTENCATFGTGDATKIALGSKSVDLVIGSPPYLEARTYGIGAQLAMREWLGDLMLPATREALRVSRGLVLWVVAGQTPKKKKKNGNNGYVPGPEALLSFAYLEGIELFRPCCWYKVNPATGGGCGQPGSGGKQWLRADWEYVLAFKNPGPLPWADPTFERRLPKFKPGGKVRVRRQDGTRAPREFKNPGFVNPGNVVKARVGGGHMGDRECYLSEAPYPEALPRFFIRAFCRPGGTVLDPFSGSGTTIVEAVAYGRNGIGLDLRGDDPTNPQTALAAGRLERRIAEGRASCLT